MITALIAAGALPGQANSKEVTALMLAAKKGNCATVKLLIEAGANVNKSHPGSFIRLSRVQPGSSFVLAPVCGYSMRT